MITCKLHNGLGNQMHMIAATYALAKRNNSHALFNLNDTQVEYQGNPASKYKDTIYKKLETGIIIPTIEYKEAEDLLSVHPYKEIPFTEGMRITGRFQSEKYFDDCKEDIRNLFTLSDIPKFDDDPNTTAVCVRRGDYLTLEHYTILTEKYYRDAMAMMGDTTFIFVSDDIEWCKNTFEGPNIYYSPLTDDVENLSLIALCTNVILANSTFAWWGAWLGEKNGMIIGPDKWFTEWDDRDVMPDRWIRIPVYE